MSVHLCVCSNSAWMKVIQQPFGLGSFLPCVGSGNGMQVTGLCPNCLYPLSHFLTLTCFSITICINKKWI